MPEMLPVSTWAKRGLALNSNTPTVIASEVRRIQDATTFRVMNVPPKSLADRDGNGELA